MEKAASPLYLKIAEDIKKKINEGVFPPNTKLPTEFEFEKMYGVSRITVRKALELLVDDEILIRKQRIGTYVMEKKISRNLNQPMSFTKSCLANGNEVSTELLSAELVKGREADLESLSLQKDEYILVIKRLRFCNGVPVMLEENHFSKKFAFLLSEDLTGSLYDILERYGIFPSNSRKVIGVCYATREEADFLSIKEGSALLLSKDVVYDKDGKPVYRGKEIINAERFEYTIFLRST